MNKMRVKLPLPKSLPKAMERDLFPALIYIGLFAFLMLVLSSCAVVQSGSISKIALLAPFEGRYREIGYNALYSVRLAIADSSTQDVHLLAVDDGGTIESATNRIHALNIDPNIEAIIVLGQFASHPDVQQSNDKPLIIVGYWGHELADDNSLMASHPEIAEQSINIGDITALNLDEKIIGNDLFSLEQVPDLYDDLSQLEIVSSGVLPDADLRERYINSDLHVPEPNLLATLTYDVSRLVIDAIQTHTAIADMTYSGINGEINFVNGYWQDAPINRYRYVGGELVAVMD
jgi:hypothetical protein